MTGLRLLWIGSYTSGSEPTGAGAGIYRVWFDPGTGELSGGEVVADTVGPSFLAAPLDGRRLYAVNEAQRGGVSGFAVDAGGRLSELGSAPTGGGSPCHLLAHSSGRYVVVANYADGGVSVHPVTVGGAPGERETLLAHSGSGPDRKRQEGPHAHCVRPAPGGRHLLVADLGTDELRCYAFGPDGVQAGAAVAARLPPGTGPRHLAVHPSGHIYVTGELDSRIHVLRWDPVTATATPVADTAATTVRGERNHPAEITLSADGTRLYVSNRGPDTIAVFEVTENGSVLRHLAETPTGGGTPRHFALLEGRAGERGHIVAANHDSDSLAVLELQPGTGIPADTGHRLMIPAPACVLPG
ncbi:lactonase family protein [Allosalinactinospora lopnorensis]|uniref:lactonase family protein n=1 Tax=Allosalinactinospora lopnorensis TaxID=1352348 RepID=UPI000623EFAC|nr:lactonase family protein [Allosalinactinospora lopnorensis]